MSYVENEHKKFGEFNKVGHIDSEGGTPCGWKYGWDERTWSLQITNKMKLPNGEMMKWFLFALMMLVMKQRN